MNVEQKYFNRRTDSDSAAVTTTRENDFTPYSVSIKEDKIYPHV